MTPSDRKELIELAKLVAQVKRRLERLLVGDSHKLSAMSIQDRIAAIQAEYDLTT